MLKTGFLWKQRSYLYAILLLLPTFAKVNSIFYLLFVAVLFFFEKDTLLEKLGEFRKSFREKKYIPIWILSLILVLSMINKLINGPEILSLRGYYSSFYLLPPLLLSSTLLKDKKFFKGLIFITAVEVLIGGIGYLIGNRSFFVELGSYQFIESYELFYDSKVFGLSANSSVLAYKVMVAIFLLDYVKLGRLWSWGLRILFVFGLLISFSRTVLLVVLVYWIVSLIYSILKNRSGAIRMPSVQFVVVSLIGLFVFKPEVRDQFTRGGMQGESVVAIAQAEEERIDNLPNCIPLEPAETDPAKQKIGSKIFTQLGSLQTSGRKLIWLNYLDYLDDNLWFGNGSTKLYAKAWVVDKSAYKKVHAHNSYIQLIATNGVILFLLYLCFYFSWMKFHWDSLPVLLGIIIYSFANYGIFWGFSYLDLLFLMFLRYKFERE